MTNTENERLLEHDFDGIKELDNFLPPWWKWLFIFTIVFFIGYVLHFHVFKTGDLQAVEYYKEMNPEWSKSELRMIGPNLRYESPYAGKTNLAATPVSSSSNKIVEVLDIALLTDNESLISGKEIYNINCVACHGANGEGLIGPNLTDEYWIHGGSIEDVVHLINVGVPAKGMISWEKTLTPQQVLEVSSYIFSLVGTNPPNPKAPEGEVYVRN